MKKNPLNVLIVVGLVGMVTAAIAAYAGTPFKSVKAFTVTCGATATLINNLDGGYNSVRCMNVTPDPVFLGGPGVTAADGYPVCSDGNICADNAITLDASMVAYCTDDGVGLPPISCIAGK